MKDLRRIATVKVQISVSMVNVKLKHQANSVDEEFQITYKKEDTQAWVNLSITYLIFLEGLE